MTSPPALRAADTGSGAGRARRLLARLTIVAAVVLIAVPVVPTGPASAAEQVTGSGSTWSAIAVLQWKADVARQGIPVEYSSIGSSTGRKFYIQKQYDFAVSEIPFEGPTKDRDGRPVEGEIGPQLAERPFAYLPIVAGGTSFMYHLEVNGQRVTNLRLSGATIAKIFTGVIKNWNDPAITADAGRALPSKPIKPVLRSDGSGTSAQFSLYLSKVYPDIWSAFCRKTGLTPCGQTSLYPYFDGSQAQAGSDGVAGAVAAPFNDGAITYVEYGYAKQRSFPVVSVRNQAGYYVQPTAGNVAVALLRARINPDRTQVLDDVYRNPDARAYPVSSYSYMIVPTSTAKPFSAGKGETLGKFILYFLCTGQQKAAILGYSPLPKNLVQFGFEAVTKIPGAPKPPPIERCANPAVQGDFDPNRVPPPPPEAAPNYVPPGGTGPGGSAGPGGRVGGGTSVTTTTLGAAAGTPGAVTTTPGTATDPAATGDELAGGAQKEATVAEQAAAAASVKGGSDSVPTAAYVVSAFVLLMVVFGPPMFSGLLRRRKS